MELFKDICGENILLHCRFFRFILVMIFWDVVDCEVHESKDNRDDKFP